MKIRIFLFLFFFGFLNNYSNSLHADSIKRKKVIFSSYVESYYGIDFNFPSDNNRPSFIYNHKSLNEIAINLAFLKVSLNKDYYRLNLGLMGGTYSSVNLVTEPGVLKNIYEANVGIKLSRRRNLWLDMGVFHSHLGFESLQSFDNLTLSRSLSAENSPYYETGMKLTFTSNDSRFLYSILAVNGWQHMKRPVSSIYPALGMQFQYSTKNFLFNYSNFAGNEKPDSVPQYRFFHNFHVCLSKGKFQFFQGFDIGFEQSYTGSASYFNWYVPTSMVKYSFSSKWSTTFRYEYFTDPEGIVLSSAKGNIEGYSINVDFKPLGNLLLRLEGKFFNSSSNSIYQDAVFFKQNTSYLFSLSTKF